MSRSTEQRIADILTAADELAGITDRGRGAYDDDPVLRRAAERLLEIIGEAAKGVDAATRAAHPEIPWQQASRLRDLLAHHYFRADPAQVWNVATQSVPPLAAALRKWS